MPGRFFVTLWSDQCLSYSLSSLGGAQGGGADSVLCQSEGVRNEDSLGSHKQLPPEQVGV
jgi:hypothetical protein